MQMIADTVVTDTVVLTIVVTVVVGIRSVVPRHILLVLLGDIIDFFFQEFDLS